MQFSLATLLALPLLAAAAPTLDKRYNLTVQGGKPNFYHGKVGSKGNCSGYDYNRCKDQILRNDISFLVAPKKEWYQCWAAPNKVADCYVWDGEF